MEREKIRSGRVVKVGPGYVIPSPEYSGEPRSTDKEAVRYLPLQAQKGDHAFFLKKDALEIQFEETDYLIIPHAAIVAIVRSSERSEEHTSELQSRGHLVCRLLLEKKNT